jgi:hypothetical protein
MKPKWYIGFCTKLNHYTDNSCQKSKGAKDGSTISNDCSYEIVRGHKRMK